MKISIMSPEGEVFSGETKFVSLPGEEGSMGILENHAPLVANLGQGSILYKVDSKENEIQISSGLVEVSNNQVTLLIEQS